MVEGNTGSGGGRLGFWLSPLTLVFGIGIGVGGAAYLHQQPPPPEETSFLNFDPETTTQDTLTFGWSSYENDERNGSFVWCASLQCSLLVSAHGERDRRLSLHLWPFRYAGAPPQSAVANLNGVVVGTLNFKDDPVVWEMKIDKGLWREGKNALRFDFAYAEAPAAHIPGSTDDRTLAAGVDWLEILPL